MSQFKRLKPSQEIRNLKSWGPGRMAQLKLFVSHLETAFGNSLAAQVSQSSKKKFSEFVPIIPFTEITTTTEYREILVEFKIPRGLRNFLSYEAALSLTDNFANFDFFTSPDPQFIFPGLLDGKTYYIKVRVLTKDGLVGPWSDTIEAATPFSQGYGLKDGTEITAYVSGQTFANVFTRAYTAIGGTGYYSIDYEIEPVPVVPGDDDENVNQSDIELQWFIDDDQVGQNFLVSTILVTGMSGTFGTDLEVKTADVGDFPTDDFLTIPGPSKLRRRGTFTQKFTSISEGTVNIILKARILDSNPNNRPNAWVYNELIEGSGGGSFVRYGTPMLIRLKNFNIFEALVA
jgi:hypothetical protein